MNKQDLLEKNNDKEKVLLSKVKDKINIVKTKNKVVCTDFLDEHEQKIIKSLLQKEKIKNFVFYGGLINAERKVLILYPEKLELIFSKEIPNKNEYIKFIRIILPKQIQGQYSHRDYLGAIMKIGIKREKIGDIVVHSEGADIIIIPEISRYLQYNLPELTRFNKAEITLEEIDNIKKKEEKYQDTEIIVPSMRLDSIVSELIKISRNKTIDIIKEEKVFLNFVSEPRTSKEVQINDILTIRGNGKYKICEIVRRTKNDRLVINVKKYV